MDFHKSLINMNQVTINYNPQIRIERTQFRIVFFLSLMTWCFGFTFASLFPKSEAIILYPLLKQFYSTVCHQMDYKSFELNGSHFLVCARCTGIYFGGLITSLIFLFLRAGIILKIKYLFIAASPMFVDVILYSSGVYPYSKVIALITGFLFGSVTAGIILLTVDNFLLKEKSKA